jgi:hypothetical protein
VHSVLDRAPAATSRENRHVRCALAARLGVVEAAATTLPGRSHHRRLPVNIAPIAITLIALALWLADIVWAKPAAVTPTANWDKPALSQRVARDTRVADLELVVRTHPSR